MKYAILCTDSWKLSLSRLGLNVIAVWPHIYNTVGLFIPSFAKISLSQDLECSF